MYGLELRDDRSPLDKQGRKPVPLTGVPAVDRLREKLRRDKAEDRIHRLPPAERTLAILDDIASREPVVEGAEDPRYEKVLEIRDKIRFNPSRTAAELQRAQECLDQFGGDAAELDERWSQLLQQEAERVQGLRTVRLAKQAALLQELAALDVEAGLIPNDSNRFAMLRGAAANGLPMTAGDHEALVAAEYDPAAQASLIARYAPQIDAHAAKIEAEAA
ncbi:MAG: hypothetical protein C0485_08005 [Pirellula sp.]|nr:hypothetical protein [Pirellula sp.]